MECSVAGCTRAAKYAATGWCQTHYHRYWRTGTLEIVPKALRTDLTYFGAHARIKSVFGPARKQGCSFCGGPAHEWAYDGTDPSEREFFSQGRYRVVYSVWPEFYMPLCHACHRSLDAGARSDRRTHCRNGHELSGDNLYVRQDKYEKACRTCKAEDGARRYQARKIEEDR